MIKEIILPGQFGDYFLFTKQIVGVDIGKSQIHATQVKAHGSSVTIERCWHELLEQNKKPHDERVVEALKKLLASLKPSVEIHTAMRSSQVVFKTLKLPFTSYNKIKMVVNFEVEPLLPFSIHDAVIDFIITKQNKEEQSSEILVAAVQKNQIAHHLSLFVSAGFDPAVITVDMFALYGLYTQIPAYNSQTGISILIDLGVQSTRIASIRSDQLYIIRSLPQGLSSIAKEVSAATDVSAQQALEQIIRFGLTHTDPTFQQALKNALANFWNKIQFALSSLTNNTDEKIHHLLLLGSGAEINGIKKFASDHMNLACELFDVSKLKENTRYKLAQMQSISSVSIMSLAVALPTPIMQYFNLRKGEFAAKEEGLIIKQMVIALGLVIIIMGSLVAHFVIQTRILKKEIRLSTQETIDLLKERFPRLEDVDDLEEIKEDAESELQQEEETWFAFTSQSRASFLEYLLELSTRINKHELGFVIEQLTIADGKEGQITLKARVRDFEALKKLEQALRESKLFSFVEGQTSPDFTMKILIGQRDN